jgi:hypothetical protein
MKGFNRACSTFSFSLRSFVASDSAPAYRLATELYILINAGRLYSMYMLTYPLREKKVTFLHSQGLAHALLNHSKNHTRVSN